MPTRYLVIGIISIVFGIILSEIAGKYNQRMGEILSMDMVFVPVAFCIMVILEGLYQAIYWYCKKEQ